MRSGLLLVLPELGMHCCIQYAVQAGVDGPTSYPAHDVDDIDGPGEFNIVRGVPTGTA